MPNNQAAKPVPVIDPSLIDKNATEPSSSSEDSSSSSGEGTPDEEQDGASQQDDAGQHESDEGVRWGKKPSLLICTPSQLTEV